MKYYQKLRCEDLDIQTVGSCITSKIQEMMLLSPML